MQTMAPGELCRGHLLPLQMWKNGKNDFMESLEGSYDPGYNVVQVALTSGRAGCLRMYPQLMGPYFALDSTGE